MSLGFPQDLSFTQERSRIYPGPSGRASSTPDNRYYVDNQADPDRSSTVVGAGGLLTRPGDPSRSDPGTAPSVRAAASPGGRECRNRPGSTHNRSRDIVS